MAVRLETNLPPPSPKNCGIFVFYFVKHMGKKVMRHSGGHLPFEADVTDALNSAENLVNMIIIFLKKIIRKHGKAQVFPKK